MTDIGMQRYGDDDIDVQATNNLPTFRIEILPSILEHTKDRVSLLDIGCGNGRFACELSEHFSHVTAIDGYRGIHPTYLRNNITFIHSNFSDFKTDEVFDAMLLFGTFYLLITVMPDLLRKCASMLSDNGVIIIVDDKKRNTKELEGHGYYDLDRLASEAGLSIFHEFIQNNDEHRIAFIRK